MGVEMHIGCLSCKKFIWLGSQKAYKWEGFQLQHHHVKTFMTWHSMPDCELFHSNDGTMEVPWDNHPQEWEEDSRSRSFWDSYQNKGIGCAHCGKLIDDQASPVILTEWFQLCNNKCKQDYCDEYLDRYDLRIYDSSKDQPDVSKSTWTIACHTCKTYYTVESEEYTRADTYKHLSLFLSIHMHKDYGLYKIYHYVTPCIPTLPWQHPATAHEWKPYGDEI
ncbi:hypothetical protein CLV59_101181 [Chitinophaga dinghuensis]|uniref:Uncharacterized protein n=1 Tax=Chitinophaga dinghuensis TaxID=1539050 RepID=A0A327WCZ7_9BACT|nr:hypothetical protein [Chitinophaga dinghuensis]RAJ87431.1 hypothetical protein CLV59_101181 [Chitinophaga dinghuensis]